MGVAISVQKVSKNFKLPHEKQNSIKGLFVNLFRGKKSYERQQVLADISFDIQEGEFFGIIGRNGSGKSTLLKMLAGIYEPNQGSIHINGKLTPFIELGVGFNPNLTGRENVFLNGALLGFNRKEMHAMYQDIVDFAEIERFMDQKLKNYSSGMQVRLAFSIAIRAKSDILLIDEVLAVGDAIFQKKCYDYFKHLKKIKRTVVLVSHDINALQEFCSRGILIDSGKIITKGSINRVSRDYIDLLNESEEKTSDNERHSKSPSQDENRWGSGGIEIIKCETLSEKGIEKSVFTEKDKNIIVRVKYQSSASFIRPVFGITISDAGGERIFQSNTLWSKVVTQNVKQEDMVTVVWSVPNAFNGGNFYISPAAADRAGSVIYDWRENFIKLKIRKTLISSAYVNIDHDISVEYS